MICLYIYNTYSNKLQLSVFLHTIFKLFSFEEYKFMYLLRFFVKTIHLFLFSLIFFLNTGVVTPPGGTGNGGGGGLLISRQSELTSNHINLHSGWFLTKSSSREVDQQHNYNYYYSHHKSHFINTQPQASPILRKSVFNPGSVFFTG